MLNYVDNTKIKIANFQKAHSVISLYYKDKVAQRSKLPLMNHINEGVAILASIQCEHFTSAQIAFCLHPLAQNNVSYPEDDFTPKINSLVREYAHYANRYLCNPETDHIKSVADLHKHLGNIPSKECLLMLLADKIQNQKDFLLHHYGKHKRYPQLNSYFNLWIKYINHYLIFS